MISGMNQGLEFIQFISTGVPEQNQWTPNNLFWDSRKILNLFCDWIFKILLVKNREGHFINIAEE